MRAAAIPAYIELSGEVRVRNGGEIEFPGAKETLLDVPSDTAEAVYLRRFR